MSNFKFLLNQGVLLSLLLLNTPTFADYASDFEQSYQQNRRAAEELRRQQDMYYYNNVILPQYQQQQYNQNNARVQYQKPPEPVIPRGYDSECKIENEIKVCYSYYGKSFTQIRSIMPYKTKYDWIIHGTVKFFHPNGKPKYVQYWKDGKSTGTWSEYDEQGNLTALDDFVDGFKIRHQDIVNGVPDGQEKFFRYDPYGNRSIDHIVEWKNGKRIN